MSRLLFSRCLAVIAAAALGASRLEGQGPTVVFSNIAASPTSDVPGLAGVKFNLGTTTQFDRPYASPDGTRWIFKAVTNQPAAQNDIIVVGSGSSGAGAAVVVQEATPTFFDALVSYGAIRTQMGINNAGQFAFGCDTTAATTSDDVVIRWDGAAFNLMAQEGAPAVGQDPGVGYGTLNNAVHIRGDGAVRFRSASLTGASTQQVLYELTAIDSGLVLAQTDISVPTGQLVAPDQSIDNLTSDRFVSASEGPVFLYHADLNGPTTSDLVMVFSGAVAAQEGFPLPGSSFVSNVTALSGDAGSQQVSSNGEYHLFRGSNADAIDWVARNGEVIAQTDQPIFSGAGELYDDAIFTTTFFTGVTNDAGDYVIGGVTNAGDVNANAVLVLNSQEVVVRENDPVDVDGNGQFDDNAFVSVFNNDDAFLTNDLRLYFNADLRDGAGTTIGQAFLVKHLGGSAPAGDVNCDGLVDVGDAGALALALTDVDEFQAQYPGCDVSAADVNGDSTNDGRDVQALVDIVLE